MNTKFFATLLMAVILMGCTQQATTAPLPKPQLNYTQAELDEEFKLRWNETALIREDNFKLKFLDVLEDSRCPPKVTCVWEGQASILMSAIREDKNAGNFTLKLRAGHDDVAVQAVDGHFVRLLEVDNNQSNTSKKIRPSNYTITLLVTKFGK